MKTKFASLLLQWYALNKRDLPWRETRNPYHIWISEIILQQTRVDQGLDYFNRFIAQFPDIESVALAAEDEILLLWQGLGYYSRARNLKYTANYIYTHYQGIFPNAYDEILSLKGIGNYTAAAIASIAYNLPYPAVDGNVLRIISRIFGVEEPVDTKKGKDKVTELLNIVFLSEKAGDFNQALMDFGALVCKPKAALCNQCPFMNSCYAFSIGNVEVFPKKSKKVITKKRFLNFIIFRIAENNEFFIYIKQRKADDIWKHLYEFPLIESESALSEVDLIKNVIFKKLIHNNSFIVVDISDILTHKLTHQTLFAKFFVIAITHELNLIHHFDLIKVNIADLKKYALPKLILNYINKHFTVLLK